MGRIKQTKSIKSFLNAEATFGIENIKLAENDMVMVLPYDLNFYDEVESLFFLKTNEIILFPYKDINKLVELINKEFDVNLSLSEYKKRIKSMPTLSLDNQRYCPVFINVSGVKKDLKEIKEVDVSELLKLEIKDILLSYMIATLQLIEL